VAVNVTSKPIYGLVDPAFNETHIHGHWQEEQRRFDIMLHGESPQPQAHGILGQGYRDLTMRNGKTDEYGIDQPGNLRPNAIDSDGMLPPMTTSAQAEGAIEGVYTDYRVPLTGDWRAMTMFKYSRFNEVSAVQSPKGPLAMRSASSSDLFGMHEANE